MALGHEDDADAAHAVERQWREDGVWSVYQSIRFHDDAGALVELGPDGRLRACARQVARWPDASDNAEERERRRRLAATLLCEAAETEGDEERRVAFLVAADGLEEAGAHRAAASCRWIARVMASRPGEVAHLDEERDE